MSSPVQQDTESSLHRALSLLDAFSQEHRDLSIRELAARAGVARSTTHRLARELVAWGALERTARGLRLGGKLFELGTLAPTHSALRETAAPFLHTLHERTRHTVNLAVRDGAGIVYLEKIAAASPRLPTRLGGRGTLHATALGKAILAFSPDRGDLEPLAETLTAFTPHTHTTTASLARELALIRRDHVAYDVGETREGFFCVAAPLLDPRDAAIGAISVTGAAYATRARDFAPIVIRTALLLSRALRGAPD